MSILKFNSIQFIKWRTEQSAQCYVKSQSMWSPLLANSTALWLSHVLAEFNQEISKKSQSRCFHKGKTSCFTFNSLLTLSSAVRSGYVRQTAATSLCGGLHAGSTLRRLERMRTGCCSGRTARSALNVSWTWRDIRYVTFLNSLNVACWSKFNS